MVLMLCSSKKQAPLAIWLGGGLLHNYPIQKHLS